MTKNNFLMGSAFLKLCIFVFLLFPFLSLFFHFQTLSIPPLSEIKTVFQNTFLQSLLSALFSCFLGFFGALGLIAFQGKKRTFLEIFCLIPNFLPQIFIILAFFNVSYLFFFFEEGLSSIVIVHTLINVSLVSILFSHLIERKNKSFGDWAQVCGISKWPFLLKGVLASLKKEVLLIFLFVFSLCFSSFTVPLMLGGVEFITLEMMIYEKIRIHGDWGQALFLAVLESGILILIAFWLKNQRNTIQEKTPALWLSCAPLVLFLILISVFVFLGNAFGFVEGWKRFLADENLLSWVFQGIIGTFIVSFGVGFFTLFFFLVLAALIPFSLLEKFLMGYVAPSAVITGFAFLLLTDTDHFVFLKLIFGISLIVIPSLYRLQAYNTLNGLKSQLLLSQSLGLSRGATFFHVILPQVLKPFCFLAGLASLWACGDFAFSSVLAGESVTLGLMVKNLMGSYRIELAIALIWLLFLIGALSLLFFYKIGSLKKFIFLER